MRRRQATQRGFTLIELLIVVGIIATLIAVAVAALTGLIGTGGPEAKASEKAAVQTAIDAYMATSGNVTIGPRATAAPITAADTDAAALFRRYLRQLPTKHSYSWTSDGTVTQQ